MFQCPGIFGYTSDMDGGLPPLSGWGYRHQNFVVAVDVVVVVVVDDTVVGNVVVAGVVGAGVVAGNHVVVVVGVAGNRVAVDVG